MTPAELNFIMEFAFKLHGKQKDAGGQPYVAHLIAVARGAVELHKKEANYATSDVYNRIIQAVAYLHDTVEDCGVPLELIGVLTGNDLMERAIDVLTHPKGRGIQYADYIARIKREDIAVAILVKRADLYHNLDPQRMRHLPALRREYLCRRYYDALDVLEGRK